jgi:hypothetical protein
MFLPISDIYKDNTIFGPVYFRMAQCESTHSSSHTGTFRKKAVKNIVQCVFMLLYRTLFLKGPNVQDDYFIQVFGNLIFVLLNIKQSQHMSTVCYILLCTSSLLL